MIRAIGFSLLVSASLFCFACPSVMPANFSSGEHQCDSCNMTIVDMRFKAEAMTKKRKLHHFDSIECLQQWQKEHREDLAERWVSDFYHPSQWIPQNKAFILKSARLPSPMGGFLSAYSSQEEFERAQKEFSGERVTLD